MSRSTTVPQAIALIGGKLQGLEAAYLARKAGFKTVLIDKKAWLPAQNLCDSFIQHNFRPDSSGPELPGIELGCILPVLEDLQTLELITKWAADIDVPCCFDLAAFRVSNSKKKSNQLFFDLNLPAPQAWPGCPFPVIVKPDSASGSKDVVIARSEDELHQLTTPGTADRVIQEYMEGPSYSIEVIGSPGNYRSLVTTDLGMDDKYDCCRVEAPTELGDEHDQILHSMALTIAEKIELHGIMDLEVIEHNQILKILEIDARLPSQTPIAVFHSTGLNMVQMLMELHTTGEMTQGKQANRHVILEHIHVSRDNLQICGEHIMAEHGPLSLHQDFFLADEALTNYSPNRGQWVATMIFTGSSRKEVESKRSRSYTQIVNKTRTTPQR